MAEEDDKKTINKTSKKKDVEDVFFDTAEKQYLYEIKQIPLLTPEEEKELARRKDIGDDEARKKLAKHNLRLVVSIAKRYIGRGIEFVDLIGFGSEGLLKAVDKFDIEKGCAFSTCATWYIRREINCALEDYSRPIRIPHHMNIEINKYKRVRKELTQILGRIPNLEEIGKCLGKSEDEVREWIKIEQ